MSDRAPSLPIRILREPKRMAYRLLEMIWSAIFVSPPGQSLRRFWLRHGGHVDASQANTALVAHVFYPDLFGEILASHRTLPECAALIVTAPQEKLAEIRSLCPPGVDLRLHAAPNRGRDVAPFLMLLNAGVLDPFDTVLKLHTKKSPHLLFGGLRRRMLYLSLAGERSNVARILSHFARSNAGLVGMRSLFRSRPSFWMANRNRVTALCARMTPPADPKLAFFEGTMFWVRVSALAPLRSAAIAESEFEAEAGQLDGTLHHALERAFSLSAMAAGYDVRDLQGRRLGPAEGDLAAS
jgi:lipopolysaccharide biosynthesis protein